MSSGSGDVKVHTEKEISPFLRSCIGEPKKHRYKLPHILFPYHSPYRSPHRQRWWPGSLPRFPYHSHPKRWAPSCRSLSISFFAYHGLRDFSKKNFYELIHSLPLRGGTSHFWREAESADPYKYEGRKAGKLKSRGRLIEDFNTKVKIRFTGQSPSHTSRSRRNNQEESLCLVERHESEKREERKDHVADTKREEEIKTQGDDQQKKRLVEEENEKKKREWQIIQENKPRAGRKQLIFTPKEIYFKYRPFKGLVFGRLTLGQLKSIPSGSLKKDHSGDAAVEQEGEISDEKGESSSSQKFVLLNPDLSSLRSRVTPPYAARGGWRWQPPDNASRWIFRSKFPSPLCPSLFV